MMDHINVKGQGGTFAAYIARPKTSAASAVVVLQELFGVNADIRKHCDELAEQGYLAVAPDLYWRQEPGSKKEASCKPHILNSLYVVPGGGVEPPRGCPRRILSFPRTPQVYDK
jgi:dienelactone hydrolase